MKIKELIKLLEKEDQNRLVIISSDSEGNHFSHVSKNFGLNMYKDGEIGLEKLTIELELSGYSEEDLMLDGKPCIVFYPV